MKKGNHLILLGKCKLVHLLWITVCRFLKKLKDLSYDPEITLLGLYTERTLIWEDARSPVFIAALFTIAKTWKQPKYLSTWMNKCAMYTHTHNGMLFSHKKNKLMPFVATWMDLEIVTVSEVRQRRTDTTWYHLYVESVHDTDELISKTEIDSQI